MKEILNLINKKNIDDFEYNWLMITIKNNICLKDIEPLTKRQQYCFKEVIRYLEVNKFSDAYHELHDCVQDYTNGTRKGDYINVNEYMAYKFLIEYFLKKLE